MATPFNRDLKKSQRALALLRKAAAQAAERDGVQFSVWRPNTVAGHTNASLSEKTVYANVMIANSGEIRRHRSTGR